jgi:hypothetical protein
MCSDARESGCQISKEMGKVAPEEARGCRKASQLGE